jgi:TonB family protein
MTPRGTFATTLAHEPSSPIEAYQVAVRQKVLSILQALPDTPSSGRVTVTFTVDSNGRLVGEPKLENQPDRDLEKIAKLAVQRAAPFTPFPPEARRPEQTFRVTLVFEP